MTRSQRKEIFIKQEVVKQQYQTPVTKQNKEQKSPLHIDGTANELDYKNFSQSLSTEVQTAMDSGKLRR